MHTAFLQDLLPSAWNSTKFAHLCILIWSRHLLHTIKYDVIKQNAVLLVARCPVCKIIATLLFFFSEFLRKIFFCTVYYTSIYYFFMCLISDLPSVDGITPTTAHAALKSVISALVDECQDLPPLQVIIIIFNILFLIANTESSILHNTMYSTLSSTYMLIFIIYIL